MAKNVDEILKKAEDDIAARQKRRQNVALEHIGPTALEELVNEVRRLRAELEALRFTVAAGIVPAINRK
ncbi:hypothetical protein [Microvirga lenta]|uniref:hypothetical protein n=1 Tax=Microvirga lenta TaxID=2881337 RepID=UPI001CFD5E88|nr:hypothetical protein [Microvirga lenta]MCB5173669.1 hypothetical protein [Microvirga lenta]